MPDRRSVRQDRLALPSTVSTLIGCLTKLCGLGLVYVKVFPFGVYETAAYGNHLPPLSRDRFSLILAVSIPSRSAASADSVTLL